MNKQKTNLELFYIEQQAKYQKLAKIEHTIWIKMHKVTINNITIFVLSNSQFDFTKITRKDLSLKSLSPASICNWLQKWMRKNPTRCRLSLVMLGKAMQRWVSNAFSQFNQTFNLKNAEFFSAGIWTREVLTKRWGKSLHLFFFFLSLISVAFIYFRVFFIKNSNFWNFLLKHILEVVFCWFKRNDIFSVLSILVLGLFDLTFAFLWVFFYFISCVFFFFFCAVISYVFQAEVFSFYFNQCIL